MTTYNTTGGPARQMTKLEYYAAQIAAGIVAAEGETLETPAFIAGRAFNIAAAMVAEAKARGL